MFQSYATTNSNEMYPPHLLAKKLNNRASSLIESGKYKEGVALLTKALKLTKQETIEHGDTRTPCSCASCRFEAVLPSTEAVQQQHLLHDLNNSGHRPRHLQQELQQFKRQQYPSGPSETIEKGGNEEGGFVYRRPIFANRESIEENHYMGVTLVWILLFNLALAHHLMYLEGGEMDDGNTEKEKYFRKAVKLYELAYQSHLDSTSDVDKDNCDDDDDYGSLRFAVIVSNNVGQIHRVAGNTSQSEECLQHLLRVIMYVVECQLVGSVLSQTELDDLYGNVTPIMLEDVCASAA